MRILTEESNLNVFNRNHQLKNSELALHTREAGTRLSFIAKTEESFLGCIEPSPDALTAKSLGLSNTISGADKLSVAQSLQLGTAMQLATYRSQGLQIYRDIKMKQCLTVMNLLSMQTLVEVPTGIDKKLLTAIDNYNDDTSLLAVLMPLLLAEANKPISINLPSVSVKPENTPKEQPKTAETK
jgi:hypothetical protein